MKIELEIGDIPDGFEPTGEYRSVKEGEWFLYRGTALSGSASCDWPILRPKKRKVIRFVEDQTGVYCLNLFGEFNRCLIDSCTNTRYRREETYE